MEPLLWLVVVGLAIHNLIISYNITKMGEVLVSMGDELDEIEKRLDE